MNWFMYKVTKLFLDEDGELIKPGEHGIGKCSMSTGIVDAPYGTMYIVSGEYVAKYLKERKLTAVNPNSVRRAIESYYFGKEEEEAEYEFVFD